MNDPLSFSPLRPRFSVGHAGSFVLSRLPWIVAGAVGALVISNRPPAHFLPVSTRQAATKRPADASRSAEAPSAEGLFVAKPRDARSADFDALCHDTRDDSQVLLDAAAWCAGASPIEVLAALARLRPEEVGTREMNLLARLLTARLAALEPELAADVALELERRKDMPDDLADIAFIAWVDQSPSTALARAVESGGKRAGGNGLTIRRMLERVAVNNVELADSLATELAGRGQKQLADELSVFQASRLPQLWKKDAPPDEMLQWIDAHVASPKDRAKLGERALDLALRRDVSSNVVEQLVGRFGEIQDSRVRMEVIDVIGNSAPELAFAILDRVDDPQSRASGWADLIELQGGSNCYTALARVIRAANLAGRDQILASVSAEPIRIGPEMALRAASSIVDPAMRMQRTYDVGFAWLASDGDRARSVVPAEIVTAFDRIAKIRGSGVLDLIPGATPELSYEVNKMPGK